MFQMMKNKPIMFSVCVLVVVFVVVMVALWFAKPKFVLKEDSVKKEVAMDKLVAWSALVAVVLAIVALVLPEMFGKKSLSMSRFRMCGM